MGEPEVVEAEVPVMVERDEVGPSRPPDMPTLRFVVGLVYQAGIKAWRRQGIAEKGTDRVAYQAIASAMRELGDGLLRIAGEVQAGKWGQHADEADTSAREGAVAPVVPE